MCGLREKQFQMSLTLRLGETLSVGAGCLWWISTPLATLIKEFYSNLSIHSNDSNTQFVKSWIQGEEYTITPTVVVSTLGVPKVQHPVYPYDESPPLDNIMSYLTGTSIQWGSDPQITSHELTEIHYLYFRIACHSIWPISHLHTIPIDRCVFLYALVTDAPMSFPYLFLRSLVEVHRSSSFCSCYFLSGFYSLNFITFRFRGLSCF